MKFENIEVGDNVLIMDEVRIGWGGGESFWLPKKVDKVTPKQFVIGNSRYKKDDGSCVGGKYLNKAKLIGEEESQLEERNNLVKRLNTAHEIRKLIDSVKVSHEHKNLFVILNKLKEIDTLINVS